MFTGLIEDIGTVENINKAQIFVKTKMENILIGDSISVNGICLTVVSFDNQIFRADCSQETRKSTNLFTLKKGDKVNLERALQINSRLGGHIVSGHIDTTTKILEIKKIDEFYKLVISCDEKIKKYCVRKGSLSVDGISLTIANITNTFIEIFVIPQTFNNTNLKYKKPGDIVNIENDILAKYIENFTSKKNNTLSLEMLKENGFI